MRNIMKLAAAISVAATPLAVAAQQQPAAPAEDEQVTIKRAAQIFGLFNVAVKSDDIPEDEKNGLVACLYSNSLKTISLGTGKLLTANPNLDANDQGVIYAAAATICGARKQPGAADSGASPQR